MLVVGSGLDLYRSRWSSRTFWARKARRWRQSSFSKHLLISTSST